jgi:flagellar biosynthesis chaperone FliJ
MKKYPLEQLIFIKKKKLQESERALREKKEALAAAKHKLQQVELERDKAKAHKLEKLKQLRDGLDEGKPTTKIEQIRIYMKIVEEKLQSQEKRVAAQKEEVVKAEEAVEAARRDMFKRQRDVEKLKEHKGMWTKEMRKELEKEEAKEEDETGAIHFIRKKKGH